MAVTINSVKEVRQANPGVRTLVVSVTLASSHQATLGDSVDLSAYTDKIFQAMAHGVSAKVKWFNILETNFATGKLNIKAFSAAAAVASATNLTSVTASCMVWCRHPGAGVELVLL